MSGSYENGETNLGFQELGQENLVQETEVKREKRPRRRGRGRKKDDGIEKDSTFRGINGFGNEGIEKDSILMDVDFGNDCFVRVPREGVICYTRKEMGEMRFVNEEEQRKKWVEVYCGLGPEVAEEYDGLIGSKNQKQQVTVEFDPRNRGDKDFDNKLINGESADPDMSTSIHNQNGHPIAEEQYCDDEESDEEYDTILRPAFFVSGEPDFDSGPPQDGLEYLRRVRYEAAQIPKVKVVKVDKSKLMSEQTAYMPQIPEIAKCPDHLLPLKKWEDAFLADFSQLRQALSNYENSTDTLDGMQPSIALLDEEEITPKFSDPIVETFEGLTAGGENSTDTLNGTQPSIPVLDEAEITPKFSDPIVETFEGLTAGGENSTDTLNGMQPSIAVLDEAEITPEFSDPIVETLEGLTAGGEEDIHSSDTCSADHSSDQRTSLASQGSDTPATIESSTSKKVVKDNNVNHPTLSTILSMEPVARVSTLRKRIRSLENMSYFSKDDCLWIFALCATIDTPLDADTSASLRSLLRKCASLRSQKTEMDDEVIMLNILATISGRYFGQLENGWTCIVP